MRSMSSVVLFGAVTLSLTACSGGHLTRSRAKSQIEEKLKPTKGTNGPNTMYVDVGTVSPSCSDIPELGGYDPIESNEKYRMLSKMGYLNIRSIKAHTWQVELTEHGKPIAGEKYGHIQKGSDCDEWTVAIPLDRFDHFDITGIVEEGAHARVDVSATFTITPIALEMKKTAPAFLLDIETEKFENKKKEMSTISDYLQREHERYRSESLGRDMSRLLGEDVIAAKDNKYLKTTAIKFEKFDDGWRIPPTNDKQQ
jgi:hypothetical protein